MKNTLFLSLGVLLSAGTLLTACSNDDDASDEFPVRSTWTLTVKATKGGNEATTRALSPGGTGNKTLYATWATTENVYVYYEETNGSYTEHGVLQPNANAADATLIGNLTGFDDSFISSAIMGEGGFDIQLQFPKKGDFTWEGQCGTLTDIAENFDWATATVRVTGVGDNKTLTVKDEASFNNLQAIVKFTLKDGADNPLNASSLIISATGLIDYGKHEGDVTITPKAETNVIWAALRGINGTVTLTATVDDDTYTYEKSGVKFENGKYYDITVKMTQKQ